MAPRNKKEPGKHKASKTFLEWFLPFWKWALCPIIIGVIVLVVYNYIQVRSTTNTMRQLARASARGNLMIIYLRLQKIRDAITAVGTKEAASRFRDLPSIICMSNLDTWFCRSFEFEASKLNEEFVRAARSYCSSVTTFSESEKKMWDIWSRHPAMQELFSTLEKVETQVAIICTLESPERYYIQYFKMIFLAASGMGLSENDLLEGSKERDIPGLIPPTPYVRNYVHQYFRVTCP
jgi:hypothetical protein